MRARTSNWRVNASILNAGDVVWFGHGTVKSPLRQAAELKGLLDGLHKAHENGVEELLMCTRLELLEQVWAVEHRHCTRNCARSQSKLLQ